MAAAAGAVPGANEDGPDVAVAVRDLVKRYPPGGVAALEGVSFTVGRGEVFGLLGPNGAGKTTTVGVLTTRIRPTSGRVRVAGVDVVADPVGARRRLAVVPQHVNLDRALRVRRNLLFHAAYFGVGPAERTARADALLADFDLADRASDRVDRLSRGQVQRLLVARALMHSPEVLFLDEPTAGLDQRARAFVWDRLRALQAGGVTIVLTTHDMDEARALADRVGVMDRGKLLAVERPSVLVERVGGVSTLDVTIDLGARGDMPALLGGLAAVPGIDHLERLSTSDPGGSAGSAGGGQDARVRVYGRGEATALLVPVAQVLAKHGATPRDLTLGRPTLDDVFVALTGRGLS